MTKTKKLLMTLLALVCIGACLCVGCGDDEETQTETATTTQVLNYTWIKYADNQPASDADMKDTISAWIGIYQGSQNKAPSGYTKYQWFKIKGENGADGLNGTDGKDGLNGVNGVDGINGVNGINGLNGADGLSAYQIASKYFAESMTETEWLASLKGATGTNGTNGLSAYELAVRDGVISKAISEEDWIKSLKGKDGKDGNDNVNVTMLSITKTTSGSTIKLRANNDGTYMVALQCYGHLIDGKTSIKVNRVHCAGVASQPSYYMVSGQLTDAQSVISVPVIAEVMFHAGDTFEVNIDGYYINYAIVNEAMY